MIELVSYGECSMKRLLIGLLLVALLVSGCRQAVVTIPPLSAPITTTTALTWDSVASLPVGTVVELTGYASSIIVDPSLKYYSLSQFQNGTGKQYVIKITTLEPYASSHLRIKIRVESPMLIELSRTVLP